MANKNLYAPYGGQKKTPHARQVTVKPGTVKAQKTQKVNPALYGGEDSIKPEASTDGHWVRGKDHDGYQSRYFVDDALSKTGRMKKKPGQGGR